jgi:hypothetical protein
MSFVTKKHPKGFRTFRVLIVTGLMENNPVRGEKPVLETGFYTLPAQNVLDKGY